MDHINCHSIIFKKKKKKKNNKENKKMNLNGSSHFIIMKIINYNKIRFFDVTLRDGLQTMKKVFSLDEKKNLLHQIIKNNPQTKNIEVGSIVSPKILPQMKDSIELYKYAETKYPNHNFYLLIPNKNKFEIAIKNNIKNLSFISSVSNSFQIKNVNKNISQTNEELYNLTQKIPLNIKTKLYISCVDECPIDGKLNLDRIGHYLNNNLHFDIENICISDTCGTLSFDNFKYIIDNLNAEKLKKVSLHLHNENNPDLVNIINYALKHNIYLFDVSLIKSGGCSVTMNQDKLQNNLTYDFFKKYS